MLEHSIKPRVINLGLVALVALACMAYGREKTKPPSFEYVGGTENVLEGSKGSLEMGMDGLTFRTPDSSILVPYSAIRLMQYRPDISRKVRRSKVQWKVMPPYGGGARNRYFAVIFDEDDAKRPKHAIVLAVSPLAMRPYLAEIDLKSGKRVEVKGYEEYESFR